MAARPSSELVNGEERRLAQVDRARAALERAQSIAEVRTVRDQAEAVRVFYRQQQSSLEAQNRAAEIKLYAERRLGELLRKTVRRGGPPKLQRATSLPDGISKTQSHRFQLAASVPRPAFEAHIRRTKESGEELTSAGLRRLARDLKRDGELRDLRSAPAGTSSTDDLDRLVHAGKTFRTIYADPPWRYDNRATRASAESHYPTMSVDEIASLPVEKLAARSSLLHLWTTNAFLFDSRRVLESWGFQYRSCFIWVKPSFGLGNYWRIAHEFLVLGVRGEASFLERDKRSWIEAERTRHSQKPDSIRALVEAVSPVPRLELFARRKHAGWTCWGNEI